MPQETEFSNIHSLSYIDLIRLSTRVFTIKPVRTFLTILGTSIGIGTVVFFISLGYGLQYILLGKLVTTQDSLISMEAAYPQEVNLFLTSTDLDNILKLQDLIEISPIAESPAEIQITDSPGLITSRLIEPNYFRLSGQTPDLGKEFTDAEPGVVLSAQGAKLINLPVTIESLGKLVSIKAYYQNPDGTAKEVKIVKPLPILGFITNENESPLVLVPANSLSSPPPTYKSFLAKAKDADSVGRVKDLLTEKGFLVSVKLDLVNQSQKILKIFTIVLGVFGVTALAVSAVGMFNTMIVSFMERTYEVGVMKSIGATDRDIRNLFLMESLIMGTAGGAVGIVLGMGAGAIVNFVLNVLAKRFGSEPFDLFITPFWFVLLIILTSAFIGVISGFLPSRRASSLSPKEAFLRR
ncbi:MAG: FtsX-like permease family protein [Candidatus Buchananbacteria bacterium]|nr:FtsX-like permease family protein [Candidatus Buchananbacteria bacterium]